MDFLWSFKDSAVEIIYCDFCTLGIMNVSRIEHYESVLTMFIERVDPTLLKNLRQENKTI